MKFTAFFISLAFLVVSETAGAALPGPRESSDIALPTDSLATSTRGAMTICESRPELGGRRSLRFLQIDKATCPGETQKAVGWDRPNVEPVSPGIPFQDQGIERF